MTKKELLEENDVLKVALMKMRNDLNALLGEDCDDLEDEDEGKEEDEE